MVELYPSRTTCRVVFTLPSTIQASSAAVIGDFLDASWHPAGHPMTRCADGRWRLALELEAGQAYEFRYWVNGCEWYNDDCCHQIPNLFGSHNSVFFVPEEDKHPLPVLPQGATLKEQEGGSETAFLLPASAASSQGKGR